MQAPTPDAQVLSSRLVTACSNSDIDGVAAAIADGACVNAKGKVQREPSFNGGSVPLALSARRRHLEAVVLLLSHGADPNGHDVMFYGLYYSTPTIFQLLIDAGGDVNSDSPPLLHHLANAFVERDAADRVLTMLLPHPLFDHAMLRFDRTTRSVTQTPGRNVLNELFSSEVTTCHAAPMFSRVERHTHVTRACSNVRDVLDRRRSEPCR